MAGKTNYEKLKAELEQATLGRKSQFNTILKIPYGDTEFGVLPPYGDDQNIFHPIALHFNVRSKSGKKLLLQCSLDQHGSCPICDKVESLGERNPNEAREQVRQLFVLYNVYTPNFENKVALLRRSQHNELIQELSTYHQDLQVDPTNPENGKLVRLTRNKIHPWARARILGKTVNVGPETLSRLLSGMANLKEVYRDYTPTELRNIVQEAQEIGEAK